MSGKSPCWGKNVYCSLLIGAVPAFSGVMFVAPLNVTRTTATLLAVPRRIWENFTVHTLVTVDEMYS